MSAIPPDIVSAAAQAGLAAREAARPRDAERAAQVQTAAQQIRAATDAAEQVDTADGDTAVFADAEGAGSQGRAPDYGAAAGQDNQGANSPPDAAEGLDIRA